MLRVIKVCGKKLPETRVRLGETVSTLNQVTVVRSGPKTLIKFDVDNMMVTKWLKCQQVFGSNVYLSLYFHFLITFTCTYVSSSIPVHSILY